ncbi:ribonucleoside hydrolase RihC, partial [Enterococcus faecalis]
TTELSEKTETLIEVALEGPATGATVADLKLKYHKITNAVACIHVNVGAFQK